jgi:HD-GYP domain-containing protein (c-di-GMP phosphodiesterase class II)
MSSSDLTAFAETLLSRNFGISFQFVDPRADSVPAPDAGVAPARIEAFQSVASQCLQGSRVVVRPVSARLQALAIALKSGQKVEAVAVGLFAIQPLTGSAEELDELRRFGVVNGEAVPHCQSELLQRLGEGALESIHEQRQGSIRQSEMDQLAAQLTRNYEEITLLYQLTREAQISQGAMSLQQLTLTVLAEMLPVRQLAYVPTSPKESTMSVGGRLVAPDRVQALIERLGAQAARSVLVDNRVLERGLDPEFPAVSRLICVPVLEGKEHFGWIIALGRVDDVELGSVEASLMAAVAAILATHQTNVKLYGDIRDLFIGIVRALTSAIDAKDPYTCGHSERVARLAYQISKRLALPEDEQNKVYLSGLLHDVGKIGIRDSVLLKTGKLTPDELTHMKEHPAIGFDILSPVRQLQPLLSGVRSHHENVDGTGYPDGLRGDDISLMARIVAAADSFDAMSSDRPYRPALDMPKIIEIFREGSGKQWDAPVVEVLLAILRESGFTAEGDGLAAKAGDERQERRFVTIAAAPGMETLDLTCFSP